MSVFEKLYAEQFKKSEENAKLLKYYEDFNYYDNYLSAVVNTFTWRNLPDETLPPFTLEQFFVYAGTVGMVHDKKENGNPLRIYPAFGQGKLLPNGKWSKYLFIRPDGIQFFAPIEECVIGYNNSMKLPDYFKILQFAKKTSLAHRAVDKALLKAIMPSLVQASDEAMIKQMGEIEENPELCLKMFFATMKGKFDTKAFETAELFDNTKIDVLALWDVCVRYRNLFYTTYGINNVEIQKRERLTEAEGAGNDEITRYTLLDDKYKRRCEFRDECNKTFGTDIQFDLNRDISTVYQMQLDNDDKIEIGNIAESRGATVTPNNGNADDEANNANEETKGAGESAED